MYDFYKTTEQHTVVHPLISLDDQQKECVVSLLLYLAGCDQDHTGGIVSDEMEFINLHTRLFQLENEFTILPKLGLDGVIANLYSLTVIQKQSLIVLFYGILVVDAPISDLELFTVKMLLRKLDVSEEDVLGTLINKTI